ncbi:MAG: cardiolipin synthase, partial [Paramuribaculum sp.]|nr:cardiolipin synthase [Paramuribaculum sp.]
MAWVYWSLTAIYFISICSIIGVVLSENRNPVKSLAWVTVLLMFPVGGIILYLFFGRSIKHKRMISRRQKRKLLRESSSPTESSAIPDTYPPHHRQQIELGKSLLKAPFFTGNDMTIYHNASDKFKALIDDIKSATTFIHLQYYIIADDKLGTEIADALIERAEHGVKVRIIYDHIGSLGLSKTYLKRLTDAGVEIYPFFKVAFPWFATRINWRNHRKICIIDGKTGYVGGMNIADRYIDGGKNFDSWRDTHIRVTGPAVASLHYSFAVDWSFMGFPLITDKIELPAHTSASSDIGMQLITSGPTSEWSNIAMLMLKAIGNARHCVYIQTPYFLPPESMLRALQAAALARVDVRIMIPRRSDSFILTYA